jgi:multiple sugar transport system permease protein
MAGKGVGKSLSGVNIEAIARALLYSYVAFFVFLMVFPVYWMFTGAFKPDREFFDPTKIIPNSITTSYFTPPIFRPEYIRWLINSFIVSLSSTVVALAIALPAGYALARARGTFFSLVAKILVLAYLFPSTFLVVGFAKILASLHLFNTYLGFVLVYVPLTAPYLTYLMYSYMFAIPKELDEAMLIDGSSRIQIFLRLVIPLSFPMIITCFLWSFLWCWNELLYALIIANDVNMITMPVGINTLQGGEISPWGQVFALSLLYTLPPLAMFYILRRYYITGLLRGAVKSI